jgi:hypothetical protein
MLTPEGAVLLKSFSFSCIAIFLCAGCAFKPGAPKESSGSAKYGIAQTRSAQTSIVAGSGMGWSGIAGPVLAAPRFVAVRHNLEIVEPNSGVSKSIEAVAAFCGTLQCELLSSSVTAESSALPPSGTIMARVAPQDLNKFLDFVEKQGKVALHATESEDKTAQVIDVEAKLKNLTDFRDSLRKMLTKPGVSVADLLQIQEKLADAQAQLDSESTQRKILANETEKVFVSINFRSEERINHRGPFASVSDALRDFASVLGDSLAALITAAAAIIPWSIVLIPGLWFLTKSIRRIRARRRTETPPPPSA